MRPRSKLFSKRRLLLPTIREGAEETVRDRNEANAAHGQPVSSEDYLLSICHLAHPTFPCRDASPDNTRHREAAQCQRRRHSGHPAEEEEEEVGDAEPGSELMCGNADPLEFLYGHRGDPSGGAREALARAGFARRHGGLREGHARSRAHSIPRASSPVPPRQRKSSCPELHSGSGGGGGTSDPDISHSSAEPQVRRRSPAVMAVEAERQPKAPVKQSLISQWISDCRSAWREARVRVCMLPAIAEI